LKSEEWLVELACQNAKLQRMVNIVSRRTNENISRPGFARLIFFLCQRLVNSRSVAACN